MQTQLALVMLQPLGTEGRLYLTRARMFRLGLFEVTLRTESASRFALGEAWSIQLSPDAVTVAVPGVEQPPPVFSKAR